MEPGGSLPHSQEPSTFHKGHSVAGHATDGDRQAIGTFQTRHGKWMDATTVAGQWFCPSAAGTLLCGWAAGVTHNVCASQMSARCRTETLFRWKVQISHLHMWLGH